jgi:nucleotide-binding universal stress UspA family protein
MAKIIACIDGSAHVDNICNLSAWASKRINANISLLHIVAPHYDAEAKGDLSGSIGIGAKSDLLKELTEIDEARGKIEQQKGRLMLGYAQEELKVLGITDMEILHRRGSLPETVAELEDESDLIIIGKSGEDTQDSSTHLGANLEAVIRSVRKPLLVATKDKKSINSFLISFDGSASSQKAINYAIENPLLKGLECHLLKIVNANQIEAESSFKDAEEGLKKAGFKVTSKLEKNKSIDDTVTKYVAENKIDLLLMGAYGHSKIRNFILGSTTTSLLRKSKVPLLLFR